jgi:hypothetical protein
MTTIPISTIGPEEKFYGYITGLGVENDRDDGTVPSRLYATFEYNGKATVWIVPDHELFAILSRHLCDMAFYRNEGECYGISKLWIAKRGDGWVADLP